IGGFPLTPIAATPSKPTRGEYYLSLVLIVAAVLFWGFSFISTKIILAEVPPASIAFFRQIISVTTLLAWVIANLARGGRAQLARATWRDLGLVAASGLFGIVLYFVFENNGIRYTTASNASMIVSAVPIFTLFTEALFFKLRITGRLVGCLILSMVGVYFVVTSGGRLDFSSANTYGNLLMMGAMVCWVAYTIINKKLTDKYSSLLLTFLQAFFSLFLFLPFILAEIRRWRIPTTVPLLHLLYLGVCCSALGYIFYVYAVKRLGATVSSAFLNLVPVVTVICGYFVLGERVTRVQLTGMLLITISLYVVSMPGAGRRLLGLVRKAGVEGQAG
ncbi:MAG: DMT family transporter, partial [Bacteroidota bacterium]